ncbi:hypothetical protein G9445_29135, partial [Escherichia coli]|nr:hypothetical protein [Escherichia coli]
SVLSLAEYGEITIDLAIKNVVEVTLDEDSESYHQVSCQFKFRHREDKTRIEKMLLDLILEAKGRCEQVPDMRSSYSSGAHPRGTS